MRWLPVESLEGVIRVPFGVPVWVRFDTTAVDLDLLRFPLVGSYRNPYRNQRVVGGLNAWVSTHGSRL